MRYFIELSYMGKAYCGWQRQPDMPTVQQTLEFVISMLLGEETSLTGAGRTDTGVNASFYVAHFDTQKPIESIGQLVYKLNRTLPRDISVKRIYGVRSDAHARFDAILRGYTYFIEPRKNAFTFDHTWQYFVELDVEKMNRAAKLLMEFDDFTSFAKLNSNNKTNICHITRAEWQVTEDGVLRFDIEANRFLRNMVRSIVGTLVDVGRGRYSVEDFRDIIASKNLSKSSAGAPAQGLYLSKIQYPDDIYI